MIISAYWYRFDRTIVRYSYKALTRDMNHRCILDSFSTPEERSTLSTLPALFSLIPSKNIYTDLLQATSRTLVKQGEPMFAWLVFVQVYKLRYRAYLYTCGTVQNNRSHGITLYRNVKIFLKICFIELQHVIYGLCKCERKLRSPLLRF